MDDPLDVCDATFVGGVAGANLPSAFGDAVNVIDRSTHGARWGVVLPTSRSQLETVVRGKPHLCNASKARPMFSLIVVDCLRLETK